MERGYRLKWDTVRPVNINVLSVPCETNSDHRHPWVELTAPFCLFLCLWNHSLQWASAPSRHAHVTDAIRCSEEQNLESMLFAMHEHLLVSGISDRGEWALFSYIWWDVLPRQPPHNLVLTLSLFVSTLAPGHFHAHSMGCSLKCKV